MTSFFDDLEAQLHAAARARTQPNPAPEPRAHPRGRRGWLRAGGRALPVTAASGTAVLIAVAALVLLGHRHPHSSPPVSSATSLQSMLESTPPPRLRRELAYVTAATNRVTNLPGCKPRTQFHGSVIHGRPGRALLSTLGVLRRPPTGTDRRGTASTETADVYSGYVRRALVAGGVSYYIAATRNDPAQWSPPAHCFALQVTALHRDLPRIPPDLRKPTVALQAGLIAYGRRMVASAPRDTICLESVSGQSSSEQCGLGPAQIKRGVPPSNDQGTFSGVVPDGVATVTLRLRETQGRTASVTAPAKNTMFALRAPGGTAGGLSPVQSVIWRSAQGRILKSVTTPDARAAANYCRHHLACLALTTAYSSGSTSSSGSSSSSSGTAYAPLKPGG